MLTPLIATVVPTALAAGATRWTVQVDPLTTAIGMVHVQVERTLSSRWSVYAGPHLRLFDGVLPLANGPYRGYGVEAGVRWYPAADAPRGPWLLARGVGARLVTTDDPGLAEPGGYGSLLAGYTGILADWLVLSGGLGGQLFAYDIGGYGPHGFSVAAHSAVGVAF
jgi:hypothetical protein